MRIVWLFLCAAAIGLAQTGTGSIQGTVRDASAAVVPKANVTVVHTATAREYKSVTNEVGFYLFPAMQSGAYEISVEFPGMETWKGNLNLVAGQSAAVEVHLKPGSTTTTVTVAGDVTPLITTNSPTIATVVERERIEQLPINGRFITTLLYMTTPGVESGSVPRVYGLRYATELLQDGAVLENREWQSIPARPPGLDTIAEFRSETNNSSAKLNRPGTFMLTTRSGTNGFHGSFFETARNSGLGVARARQDYYTKPPHLVRNEFGASLGGPVWIPKLYNGRNRTFFFFAYEGYELRSAATRNIAVPTPAFRQGDFSGLVDGQGRRFTVYDPLSTDTRTWARQPFPGNQIPAGRQSPLAKYLYSVTPMPTHPDNPLVGSNWFGLGFNNTSQHTETVRVDHKINDSNHLFFRYTHSPGTSQRTSDPYNASGSPTTLDYRANANIDSQVNDSGIANWTHTFSPTFFSETLVTVARDYRGQLPYTGGEEIASQLGLPNPFGGIGFPRIPYSMSSATGPGMSYDSSINPTINYGRIFNVDQNFTKVHGRHEFQFGVRFRYEQLETLNDQQISQGQLDYNNVAPTGLYDPTSGTAYGPTPFTGHTAANFFLGTGTYQARFNRSWYRPRVHERAGYFQDNFKVNSRLTLNLGLRYEYNSPVNERDKTIFGFEENQKAVVLGRSIQDLAEMKNVLPAVVDAYTRLGVKFMTPQDAGLPDSMVYSNLWDFGPRAGFAYRVGTMDRPTVIRGGYSIFAYPESLRLFAGNTQNTLPGQGNVSNNANAAEQSPDGLPNYLLRSVPTIIAGVNSSNALDPSKISGITRGSGNMYYLDPRQPTARAHQWNLLVEREMFANTVVKLGYIGTHGMRMSQWYTYNDAAPGYVWYATTGEAFPTGEYANVARRPYDQQAYGVVQRYQKTGYSNFNGFQVEFEHRYSKGFAFQVFYVLSNAMRVAGDGWRDDILRPANYYLPGTVPTDDKARNRLLFYRRDTGIPKHRVNWNFLVDLPFGRGKAIGGNFNRFVDALIGGWQIAGNGTLTSRYFQLPTSYWGAYNGVQVYDKQHPIQDCRSGVCYDGWLYWNGDVTAAIREYQAVLRLDPNFAGVKFELAMCHVDSQEPDRAIPLLREVVAAEPSNTNARFQLGWVLAKKGDCAAALPWLETATESAQKHYLLAGCYKKLNRAGEAAAELAKVKELREGADARMQAKYLAAMAHQKAAAGQLDEAIDAYRASLAQVQDSAVAIDLAVALLKKGDAQEVLRLLGGQTDPLARYQMALAYVKLGRHADARTALEAAVRDRPGFVEAWYQLGVSLIALGKRELAERALATAVRLRPDEGAIRLAWAESLEQLGRVEEARDQRQVASKMPR